MGTRNVVIRIALCSVAWAGHAGAEPADVGAGPTETSREPATKQKCFAEYENAQVARQAGKLRDARASLLICSSNACPELVQADCVEWLGQVDKSLPTVVFSVRVEDEDESRVRVYMDGQLVMSQLDGKAVPVDPGPHTFRFEHGSFPPIEQQVVVSEGEKERALAVVFGEGKQVSTSKSSATKRSPAVEGPRPVPAAVYVLGGCALAGIGGFTYFGLSGKSERKDLLNSCAPFCPESDVTPIQTKLLIADISLGVSVLSVAAATWIYLVRPVVPARKTGLTNRTLANFALATTDRGAAIVYRGGF